MADDKKGPGAGKDEKEKHVEQLTDESQGKVAEGTKGKCLPDVDCQPQPSVTPCGPIVQHHCWPAFKTGLIK